MVKLSFLSLIPSTCVRTRCDCYIFNLCPGESEVLGLVGQLSLAGLMSPGSVTVLNVHVCIKWNCVMQVGNTPSPTPKEPTHTIVTVMGNLEVLVRGFNRPPK